MRKPRPRRNRRRKQLKPALAKDIAARMNIDLLLVGRVTRSHGLSGECKIVPESDDPDRLLSLKRVWIGTSENAALEYKIQTTRRQHTKRGITILMRLFGIDTVEKAKAIARQNVYALEEDLPPLEPGEYFLHDLPGCSLKNDKGELVGQVADVLETPAGPMLKIMRPFRKDSLVPLVPEFIRRVDVNARSIFIAPLEGLLD